MNFSHRPYPIVSQKTAADSSTAIDQTIGQKTSQVASAVRRSIFDRNTLHQRAALRDLRYVALMFGLSRLVLIAVGLIARAVFPPDPIGKATVLSRYAWLDMWGVWDSYWYMDIVQNGYSTASRLSELPDQTNLVFFPLYPLSIRLVSHLTGGDYFVAGLLISNVCLLISCYLLYLLVKLERGRQVARRTVKYLLLFPVSFVLSGLLTESLYLCLTLLCFYLARKRQWWLAGLCGAALSATRSLGVLIALPLAFEYLRSRRFRLKAIRWDSLFVLLVPLGLAAFCFYSYRVTGDFLFFKTNQAAWNREVVNPVLALWQAVERAISEQSIKTLLEICFCLAGLGVLIRCYRALNFSYLLFGLYSILIPLSAGIASMPRFTVPIFPLYLGLALIARRRWRDRAIMSVFCILQIGLMMLWSTGQGLVI